MNKKEDFRKYAISSLGTGKGTFIDYVINSQENIARDPVVNSLLKSQKLFENNYQNPYILEERQLNVTQMDVFSRLMMDRIIFLNTEVNDHTMGIALSQILYLNSVDPEKDIKLYINSPGGGVYAGLSLIDTMNFIDCDVAIICSGMAASMAAMILVSGSTGKRFVLTHS